MRVRFLPDARAEAGGGHVSRCLAVAEFVREAGGEADFVLGDPPPWTFRAVEAAGFHWSRDLKDAIEARGREHWVVIDDYTRGIEFEQSIRTADARILVLDDVPNRRHDCDVLVDPGGRPEDIGEYSGLVPESAAVLAGPRFAPLRAAFAQARRSICGRRSAEQNSPLRLWTFFGRVDRQGLLHRSLLALSDPRLRDLLAVHTVVTGSLIHAECVRSSASRLPDAVVLPEIQDMAAFLAGMDIALTAGGVGMWELCCLGVPALCAATVANQRRALDTAARLGAIVPLPPPGDLSPAEIADRLAAFVRSPEARTAAGERARQIVDGTGARRIAAMLNDMEIREAEEADAMLLWRWANDPAVRSAAFRGDPIDWDDHRAWFAGKLADPRSRIYLGLVAGVPVGQVRFDLDPRTGEAEIDISVAAEWRGKRRSEELLLRAEAAWRRSFPRSRPKARVKRSNPASLGTFEAAGFVDTDVAAGLTFAALSVPE
jgi:spore coat polysaccharide biosynthesis predicted glycosyltransferase SpsG